MNNEPNGTPCQSRRLAAGPLASVELCSCGCLQLKLANVSLRFTPAALGELVGTLGEAMARYNAAIAAPALGPAVPWPGADRGQA